ncbi:gliding motility-associated C-terminal domain-containing protein [Tenacibaculum ovolyticum]|uniref:HYR-like domain-containing protein n=1 Tax=Tenacibaculum ovolyticum TaxID=104270 RepID=UPI003BAA208D
MKVKLQSVLKTVIIVFSLLFSQLTLGQDEIVITKEIVNNTSNCKQFDVTLTITGNPPAAAQEVVLVIDVSGSMGDEVDDGIGAGDTAQIMDFAKEAAKDFIEKLLSPINNPTNNNKIAIISYGSSATVLTGLTGDKTVLNNFIDGLNANGGTNMEDALIKADEVLSPPSAQGTFDCTTTRSIILLTDGVPTMHNNFPPYYGCSTVTLNTECQTRAFSAATAAETTIVAGKEYNQSIFTVGFTGTLDSNQKIISKHTLDTIENSGAFYTDSAADLTNIYSKILGQLVPAATALSGEPLIKEEIPSEFQIVSGSLVSSSTIDTNKGSGTYVGQTINWSIDKVVEETITLKYSIVAVDSNYCGNVPQGTSTASYLNSDCVEITNQFDNPEICIPCPVLDLEIDREGCTNSINYSMNLTGETCGSSVGNYSWEFYLNAALVGTSTNESGKFDYAGVPDFIGEFKAKLIYNGTYTVTGCTIPAETATSIMVIPSNIIASGEISDVTCYQGNNGNIDLSVSGGYGAYQYIWSNGATTEDISDLVAGDYSVTITDAQGCSFIEKYTITSPSELTLSLLGSDLSCGGNDGGIDLTVTGGTSNYTYLWSNGATTEDLTNLNAGMYSVTVTDANGCEKTIATTLISLDTEVPTITVPEALKIGGCNENSITTINARYPFSLIATTIDVNTFSIAGYLVNDDNEIASITYKDEVSSYDGCITKVTRTFKATDNCGKIGVDSTLITVKDNIKPEFTVPADITIYTDANCAYDSALLVTGDVTDETDNCDNTLNATSSDVITTGSCEGEQIITRTWTLTDDCGNTTTKDQTITVQDNIKPEFTVPTDITIYTDANCAFDSAVLVTGDVTDETDNCDNTLNATSSDVTTTGSCEGEQIITRTWTLTDDCGNTTTKDQTITVKDNIKPEFTVPADITIYTDANCAYDSAVLVTDDVTDETDNCDNTLNATSSDVTTTGSCEGEQIITRTWTLTDDCGNTTTKDQTITVKDNIKPEFTVPTDITIYTDANCAFDSAVLVTGDVTDETDNCDNTLNATSSDVTTTGSCEGEQIITRTWTLTDDCGNTTTKDQTITVKDNIKPEFTVPADITIYTDANCAYDSAVLVTGDVTDETDNCDNTLNATSSDVTTTGSCEGEQIITRTWTLTDDCGNTTTKDQTITVKDNIKPEFTVPADVTIYTDANCAYDSAVLVTGDVTDETDNCDNTLNATSSDVTTTGSCEGEQIITRTWTLTDDCGNTTTKDQTITVKDNIKPEFTVPADITIYTDANCAYDSAVLVTGDVTDETDNCDNTLNATFNDVTTTGSCEGEQIITRTWTLTDDCGNTTTKDQTITVKDNIKPEFTVPTDITIYTDANCAYDSAVLITGDVTDETDNCDNTLNATSSDVTITGSCKGEQIITRTWTLTDDCGNTTTKDQTITVKDNIKPEFTVPADVTIYTDANCAYDSAVLVTGDVTDETDNCDNTLNATSSDVTITGSCKGEQIITRTWTLTDDCGNTTTKDQTITVKDNIKPEFTVPADVTIYTDANCAYDSAVLVTGDVTDETDNCDNTLNATSSDVTTTGSCEGEQIITRTWTLTDDCGNTTTKDQTITVQDIIAPIITNGQNIEIECGTGNTNQNLQDWLDNNGNATATDNCSNVTWSNNYGDDTSIKCDRAYINVIFTAKDTCGNEDSITLGYLIKDDTAPTITTQPLNKTVTCDGSGNTNELNAWLSNNGGAIATDDCSTITWENNFTELNYSCSFIGEVEVIFTAKDACGNFIDTEKVKFTIEDNEAPLFVENLPGNITVSCATVPNSAVLTAIDNCSISSDLEVIYTEEITGQDDACSSEYQITRKWMVSDCAGNITNHTQEITVEDNEAPILITVLNDVDVNCDMIPEIPELEFTDNCSGKDIEIIFKEETTSDGSDNDYQIIRTWIVSDTCGNSADFNQTINVTVKKDIIEVTDAKCFDDGIIDLNDYIDSSIPSDGKWEVVTGEVSLTTEATFDPININLGDYVFTYKTFNEGCFLTTKITININDKCFVLPCGEEDVTISKAVTPNGDTWNEFFKITGVETCGYIINVKIFNRWGAKVFESDNYTNDWNGISEGVTLGSAKRLPSGTYYYIVILENSGLKPFTGAIYLGTK